MDLSATTAAAKELVDNVERVITGKTRAVELATIALLAGQHLLVEDVPGVGKTMLGRAIALSIDGSFKRIQGTSDLLPADITGSTVFDQSTGSFSFVPGPIFANVVLFDEINRAAPKAQSALLQVMDEGVVSSDGDLYDVPKPFFVVATRNPVEHHGTFPLPEGALDRFGLSIEMGYPAHGVERRVIEAQLLAHPVDEVEPVMEPEELVAHQAAIRSVYIDGSVLDYIVSMVRATREHASVALGASPRASVSLTRAAQASAVLRGRDYVLPDDVQHTATAVLTHRVLLAVQSTDVKTLLDEITGSVPVPVESNPAR